MFEKQQKNVALFFPGKSDAHTVKKIENIGSGHINRTYYVLMENGDEYIMQCINTHVFPSVDNLTDNFVRVTDYIRNRGNVTTLKLIASVQDKFYARDEEGLYWRMMEYVKNAYTPFSGAPLNELYESGIAFGQFHEELKDFPAHTLNEILPNFHNTPLRYNSFHAVLEKDPLGRAKLCQEEINFYLEREKSAGELMAAKEAGTLKWMVTHNDTKITNVMLDNDTHKAVCAIDLDTVMPGLVAFDVGDAVRFSGSDAAEDEKDLSKVVFKMESFKALCQGFADARPGLAKTEKESFAVGSRLMTLECGLRFLTDYIDGDHYFHTEYDEHNLVRSRTQMKLVHEMENKWDKMQNVIDAL